MCGIIGIKGKENIIDILLTGLKKLEYRGYDSVGVAYKEDNNFKIVKKAGRIESLVAETNNIETNLAIGHTRWATHGVVNQINAHPHISFNQKVILVHNGVIDNYLILKQWLTLLGYNFYSQTDSEVIANLIDYYYKDRDFLQAIYLTSKQLEGNYALVIINKQDNNLYFAKKGAPLYVGLDAQNKYIVSDILAISNRCSDFINLPDGSYGYLDEDPHIYQDHKSVSAKIFKCEIEGHESDKGLYPHYMIKEIEEQPSVIRRIVTKYIGVEQLNFDNEMLKYLASCSRLYIIACGTSYHAGLIGKNFIEASSDKEVFVYVASEFAYFPSLIPDNSLFILISQSGETADLKKALEVIKKTDSKVITLTNVMTSYLASLADYAVDISAGPEISVASTKAYTATVCILALFARYLSNNYHQIVDEFNVVIKSIEKVIENRVNIETLVRKDLLFCKDLFFIGRGIDYLAAMEASLKIKEISYIHSEAFQGGELKHGSIALIDIDVPVIGIISSGYIEKNLRINLQEVKARGANIITIVIDKVANLEDTIVIQDCQSLLNIIPIIVCCQYLAYYSALLKGNDVDKPRHLAKSVTVE